MISSTVLHTKKNRILIFIGVAILAALFLMSLWVGKYPLSIDKLVAGDELQWKIFINLRITRALTGLAGGFALGVAGYVFQIVFRNPLAAPDIIGVSSGASAGAAAGILFLSGTLSVTICAFLGAILAVVLALMFAFLDRSGRKNTVVLAGIVVHSLAQTVLMCLKLTADPERELASIEYWIMGSLNAISADTIGVNLIICVVCLAILFMFHRQIILLSADEDEARLLGADVNKLRLMILILATLVVAAIVSLTGLISFVGLLAPHIAKRLTSGNDRCTMKLSGLMGGCILVAADILARSVAQTELPVSIFTSLLGAPFLVLLIAKGEKVGYE